MTLGVFAHDNDTGFIGVLARGCCGINRNHDPRQLPGGGLARGINDTMAPQRAWRVVEQLGVELLPTEARPLVFADDLVEEPGRQIRPVFVGRAPRYRDVTAFAGEQFADQLGRPRRRGHHTARVTAQSQPELQHVPSLGPRP